MASAARRTRKRTMDGPEIGQRTAVPRGLDKPKFSPMYRLRESVNDMPDRFENEQNVSDIVKVTTSEDADRWAISTLQKSGHGWHGLTCATCTNRYMTLTIAFDAGYAMGYEKRREDVLDDDLFE